MEMRHVQVKTEDNHQEYDYTHQVFMSPNAAFAFIDIIEGQKKLEEHVWIEFLESRDDVVECNYTDENNIVHAALVCEPRQSPGTFDHHFKLENGKKDDPRDSEGNNILLAEYNNVPLAAETTFHSDGSAQFDYFTNDVDQSPQNSKGEVLINPVNQKPYFQVMNFVNRNELESFTNEGGSFDQNTTEVKDYNRMLKAYLRMKRSGMGILGELDKSSFVTVHPKADPNRPA